MIHHLELDHDLFVSCSFVCIYSIPWYTAFESAWPLHLIQRHLTSYGEFLYSKPRLVYTSDPISSVPTLVARRVVLPVGYRDSWRWLLVDFVVRVSANDWNWFVIWSLAMALWSCHSNPEIAGMPVMAAHYTNLRSKHDFTWGGRSLLLYFTSSSLSLAFLQYDGEEEKLRNVFCLVWRWRSLVCRYPSSGHLSSLLAPPTPLTPNPYPLIILERISKARGRKLRWEENILKLPTPIRNTSAENMVLHFDTGQDLECKVSLACVAVSSKWSYKLIHRAVSRMYKMQCVT